MPEDVQHTPEDKAELERLMANFSIVANGLISSLAPAVVGVRSATHMLRARYLHPDLSPDTPPQFTITLWIDDPFAKGPIGKITVERDGEVRSFTPADEQELGNVIGSLYQGMVFPLLYSFTIDLGATEAEPPVDPEFLLLEQGD